MQLSQLAVHWQAREELQLQPSPAPSYIPPAKPWQPWWLLRVTWSQTDQATRPSSSPLPSPPHFRWDPYLTHTEALQVGRAAQREMLVRWRRSFPLHFLTDREYIIARRAYVDSGSGSLYGIERAVPHKAAEESHVVAVQRYYSMYRCRDVQDPWGEGRTGGVVVCDWGQSQVLPVDVGCCSQSASATGGILHVAIWWMAPPTRPCQVTMCRA
jgi:hypothetical protein